MSVSSHALTVALERGRGQEHSSSCSEACVQMKENNRIGIGIQRRDTCERVVGQDRRRDRERWQGRCVIRIKKRAYGQQCRAECSAKTEKRTSENKGSRASRLLYYLTSGHPSGGVSSANSCCSLQHDSERRAGTARARGCCAPLLLLALPLPLEVVVLPTTVIS